jgi:ribonuclease HI
VIQCGRLSPEDYAGGAPRGIGRTIWSQMGQVVAQGCQFWSLPHNRLNGATFWNGWPMRGWRIGEATKPGPPMGKPAGVRIVVANVTSWAASWRGLISANADVYCVQEARIAVGDMASVEAEAAVRGLVVQPGDPQGGEHLLCFAHKAMPKHLRAPAMVGIEQRMRGRMQYAVVHFGRRQALHIVQLYGIADGSKAAADFNASLVLAAVAWLSSLGDVPMLVVGDFNLNIAHAAIDAPLAMAGWVDVMAEAGPTCIPSNGAPSRIDYVLASRPATALIETASLRWDLGLATHAALVLEMRADAPEKTWMRKRVDPLDGPQSTDWPAERSAVTAATIAAHEPAFSAALASGNFDASWRALESAMRQWLSKRRGDEHAPERQYAHAEWRAEAPRASGSDGEAQGRAADIALLRLRRLRALRHALGVNRRGAAEGHAGCMPYHAQCIINALVRSDRDSPEWNGQWHRVQRWPTQSLQPLIDLAEREYQEEARAQRRRRKDAWFKWVTEALEDGGGRLYRWIRGGAVSAAAMVPDPCMGGESAAPGGKAWILALRGGAAAQLRSLERHWRRLWQRECKQQVPEEWLVELDTLPSFPARTPWTIDAVRDVLRRMAKRKAAGLDGWSVAELRLLPDELLEMVVRLFEAVEDQGRWPTQLCAPEGLLLPKGGATNSGDPMDRRPIWWLPMLYRVWAAGRARLFARWRLSWPDGDGSLGAEELAWELALDLEAAEANGEDICGAALEWRKAFDNVPLSTLDSLLRRARLPNWVRRPIIAAYTAPRRLRVEGAIGRSWTPSSGILPGCALAVFVLSVLTRPWDRRMSRVHDLLRRRTYVDDMTFWARGEASAIAPAITEGLGVTKEFGEAMDWRLHTGKGKSTQFANTAAVRAWLKGQAADFEVQSYVKDLGVVAAAGRRARAPVAAGRMAVAANRMKRIGRIPVPFDRRCQLAATSGMSAGIYGSACGAPPARDLENLRRAARAAVCHGGCRAAPEIVFGLLSPTWRLDPKAVTVIAPIWQAVKALRAGRLRLDDWQNTACAIGAGHGRRIGPVAAALRGMQRLGLGADITSWTGISNSPLGWKPADHTKSESLGELRKAWRKAEYRELATRRNDFTHVADGIDEWATMRLLRGGVEGLPKLQSDAAGALRTVLTGNVVTERVASHWTSQSQCPHCGLEVEDHEHRFWRCPRWEGVRTAALGAPDTSRAVRAAVSSEVARTGVMAAQPELIVLAEAARAEPMHLPPEGELAGRSTGAQRCKVWSDGSCMHPLDPLMSRAAWGIRVQGYGGTEPVDYAGPVNGAQTAQRAEVAAALAAACAVNRPIELVTDSRWVVRSIASLAAGASPAEWRHADLWAALEPYVRKGNVVARWTPAHKTSDEYAQRGLLEEDRQGNDAADENAKAAAVARLPPAAIVESRRTQLQALARAQRVIAYTELAALKANHGNGADAAPRVKRRWGDIRRGVRAARQASARACAAAVATNPHSKPGGVVPPPLHDLQRDGEHIRCIACGKSAVRARWTAFAYGACGANACGERWPWRRIHHQATEGDGRMACGRCSGSVPLGRRAAFEGRRCPAWKTDPPSGSAHEADAPDWGAWYLRVMGHKTAGCGGARESLVEVTNGSLGSRGVESERTMVPSARIQALFAGAAWRSHVAAQGPGYTACISCGAAARRWPLLESTPCPGWRDLLPPRVAALIMLSDDICKAGGPPVRFAAALAARRGEVPRPPE